jgi:hypothetical protein
MSLLWTILSTLVLGVLTIAALYLFEISVHPNSAQRQQVANVVWPVAGLLCVLLWVWFFKSGKRGRRGESR